MTLAVLLAHGSPDPRSGDVVRRTADLLAERLGSLVVAAFLDHQGPDLTTAVGAGTDDDVVVLPLLLSSAYHARVDVPEAVAALGRDVELLAPVGHPAAVLDALLVRAGGRVVVVAAGTKVDEERAAFATSVVASSVRTGVAATSAYATGPGPRLDDAGDVEARATSMWSCPGFSRPAVCSTWCARRPRRSVDASTATASCSSRPCSTSSRRA